MQQSDGLEKSALDDKFCQLRGVLLIKIGVTPQTGAFEMDWQNTAIKLLLRVWAFSPYLAVRHRTGSPHNAASTLLAG
tara:strand:- start:259 stop:492 length:234 start_codon:yes stop_codon:yes gene_type:complete